MIPSIDLLNGRIVQLEQGKKVKISLGEEPLAFAKRFSSFEETQVVDLDAAMGTGSNLEIVKGLCGVVNARAGGGVRSIENARKLFKARAKKVIVGTSAEEIFLEKLCKEFGKYKIIAALDSYKGKIAIRGWKKTVDETPIERAKRLQEYCGEFLYTCIEKEGLMQGIDWETIKRLKSVCKNSISVAGGISSIEEIRKLESMGFKAVVGMALYTGKIKQSDLNG